MADTFGSAASPANFVNAATQIGGNQIFPILQIVTANTTTITTTTSSTYQSTNLTASITPKFNTSKVLVLVTGTLRAVGSGNNVLMSLFNGSTDLSGGGGVGFAKFGSNSATTQDSSASIAYYDSPATTSAVTYTVKIKSTDNTNSVSFAVGPVATITLIEIAQ